MGVSVRSGIQQAEKREDQPEHRSAEARRREIAARMRCATGAGRPVAIC
ncbi:hypothetical protein GGR04_003353 [Aureimonas pseudogalii]|uniref:Uncharacterized protein n=1 Tax=Aureimonas pseudogalii TaxID=1744844 RepID=A0A7W6H6J2_9HYPH|nr:hypothetical protein [Aureimonas pseudogalii]